MTEEEDPLVTECRKRVGTMLSGKWRLDALIGVGGMAAVYASSHRNGARAAIKILHAEYAGHQEVRARFLREAYIANKVEHPGTVKVMDDDVSESGEPYIVMELLAGESVESRASRNGGWLRYPEVLSIVEQTLAVLERAHAEGIVHRDLKPDNLFLSSRGEVKVLDFGIARLHEGAQSKRTQTGMMMGTPAYMAPEQALGKWQQVDGRTDLWSVGAILFTLLSGRHVHEANTDNEMLIRAATRPAPSLARVAPNAPIDLVRVADKALAFDQANRYPDAAAFRLAIRQLMAQAGVAPFGTAGAPQAAAARPPPAVAAGQGTVAGLGAGAPPPPVAPREADAARPAPSPGAANAPLTAAAPAASTFHSAAHGATLPQQAAPAGTPPASVGAAPPPPNRPAAARVAGDADGHSAAYATPEDVAAMRELFTETERALIARRQYGPRHPETRRRADRAFKVAASGLMHGEYGLVWNVTPYSFVSGEQTVWEPEAPLDRIPYQLFADGVRLLGLSPGLSEDEFQAFFHVVTLDRATEVAPEDDFATLLWDADFQSVVYQVVDTFADGDHAQRVRFEAAREGVVALAHVDTSEQLSDCWAERQAAARTEAVQPRFRAITSRLGSGGPVDAEAAARAADMKVATGQTATVVDAAALRVDDALRTMLGARLTMETGGLSERFTVVVARAYEDGAARDAGAAVTTPLRFAIDGLAAENPDLAIDMVGALCREVGGRARAEERDALRARFAAAIVSPKMLEAVLEGVSRADAGAVAVFAKGLRTILGYCDATYFGAVLPHLGRMPDEELREVLVEYVVRTGAGREAELGAMFKEADIELGLMLVRILAQMGTKGAREAISHASSSPHPVVRIEALGHVEGVSSERLRLELRALLEDREPGVRLAALRTMEQYAIRVAGPFLVLRVRAPEFDALSQDERRQALRTLAALAPTRAEAVALELLGDRRLITADEHEVSRELAADVLGQLAVTDESRKLLAELATARLRNSDRVRHAAGKALEAFDARVATLADAAARPPAPARSQGIGRQAPVAQPGAGKGTRG